MKPDRGDILLGYSGGMDSTVAARRLREAGYRVVALTIDTTGDSAMLRRARARAEAEGIEWHSVDARELFRREIVDYFIDEYCAGHTPAPCTRCNTQIKWRLLESRADACGIRYIATGHYFNIVREGASHYVACADDPTKDQSYYLWGLAQRTLRRTVAVMGDVHKSDIRRDFEDKSESMGICFLCGERYADFIRRNTTRFAEGDIVDIDGNIVGRHAGLPFYTIGQKRGEGIPAGSCIIAVDPQRNRIVAGRDEDLYRKTVVIGHCNIVDRSELRAADITAKIRGIGRNPQLPVAVTALGDGYRVYFADEAWAPAVGQPLVLYRGGRVIGGGIITNF